MKMARIVVVLILALGIFSTSYGLELPSAKQFVTKLVDKANTFIGKQKQTDHLLELPENAFPVENPAATYVCKEDGLFDHPTDCTLGVMCTDGTDTIFSCTDVLHFNNITKKCDNFCSAHCDSNLACICGWKSCETSKETSSEEDTDSDEQNVNKLETSFICLEDGLFAYPTNCNHYIQCSNSRASLKMCPSGMHFNRQTERCDKPCDAACDRTISCNEKSKENFSEEIDCLQDAIKGDCHGNFGRYYFDVLSGKCQEFTYGGCGGNSNNFKTIEECENKCMRKVLSKEMNSASLQTDKIDDQEQNNLRYSFTCRKDGLFADPNHCNQYINCLHGNPTFGTCPPGLHFNKKIKICDTPCAAKCDPKMSCRRNSNQSPVTEMTLTEDFTTLDDNESAKKFFTLKLKFVCTEDGLFPNLNDCRKYIHCSSGISYDLSCPRGKHFNRETKKCDVPCSAKCDPNLVCKWRIFKNKFEETIFKGLVDSLCSKDGVYGSPMDFDCLTYYKCEGGDVNAFQCPEGQHFSKETLRCEEPCQAHCDSSIAEKCGWKRTTAESDKENDIKESVEELCSKDGVYIERNPINCETYFSCENGDAHLFHCPDGQHFNRETLRCAEPCVAGCDLSLAEKCNWIYTEESENVLASSLKQPVFDFHCPNNGLFPNIACENFIQCTGGQGYLINCPYGQHFNYLTERCTSPCLARCDPNYENFCTEEEKNHSPKQQLKDFDCVTDGYHVDPLDCDSFIQCFRGEAYAISCPAGLHYSPTLEICTTPCEAKCAPNYEEFCRADELNRKRPLLRSNSVKQPFPLVSEFICTKDGIYKNPEECTSFIQCVKGESFTQLCPEELHFNENTQRCESPCDAHCDSSIGTTCGWDESWSPNDQFKKTFFDFGMFSTADSNSLMYHFTCMKDGIFKNPENCTTFIQCAGGHSYVMACPAGLHFNEEMKRCDYPCSAQCDSDLACDCGWETCNKSDRTSDEVDCEAEPEVGPCKGRFPRYAYDTRTGRCIGFYYGGCGGNSNNFETQEECENECQKKLLRGFKCPADNGMFGHYPDCMSYYHCKRGVPILKKCPKGTAFDHKKSKCVTEYQATCVYECQDKDAVYPYEVDCHKYIDCVNGISKLEKCPRGKAFDPQEKDCIDEKRVDACPK